MFIWTSTNDSSMYDSNIYDSEQKDPNLFQIQTNGIWMGKHPVFTISSGPCSIPNCWSVPLGEPICHTPRTEGNFHGLPPSFRLKTSQSPADVPSTHSISLLCSLDKPSVGSHRNPQFSESWMIHWIVYIPPLFNVHLSIWCCFVNPQFIYLK